MGYSLDQLARLAEHSDVSFRVNYYLCSADPDTRAQAEQIRQKGWEAEVLRWLRSTSQEGMRFGMTSKEDRFHRARSYAELAKLTVEDIAKKHNLEHLLINPK